MPTSHFSSEIGTAPRNQPPAKASRLRGASRFAPMIRVLLFLCYPLEDSDSPGKPPIFVVLPFPARSHPASTLFQISKSGLDRSSFTCSVDESVRGESFPPDCNQQAVFRTPPSAGTPRNAPDGQRSRKARDGDQVAFKLCLDATCCGPARRAEGFLTPKLPGLSPCMGFPGFPSMRGSPTRGNRRIAGASG